jgi:DNA-binding SARP family transcriptional activator/tetratricopeptide (TPR) repeat protein
VARPRLASAWRLADVLTLGESDRALLIGGDRADTPKPRIEILGPLKIFHGGAEVQIPSGKLQCLLALLALQPQRLVPTDEIVDMLWEDAPPKSCSNLIHTYANRLRAILGSGTSELTLLSRRNLGYLLHGGPDHLDVMRFEEELADAQRLHQAGHADAARLGFEVALDIWRGSVLSGLPARLRLHPDATALTKRRTDTTIAFTELAISAGKSGEAVGRLQALVAEDPLQEQLQAMLMRALAASGQQAAALAVFASVRTQLVAELGIEPGADLAAAYRGVLNGRQSSPSQHHLQTATGRGHSRSVPAQLPAAADGLVGRGWHLRRLTEMANPSFRRSAMTVSVISGMAGVGKTALAVRWAHDNRARFDGGQLFADLHGFSSTPPLQPDTVLAHFLHALGVPPGQVPIDLDEAAGLYRSLLADRRMLIVLDNAGSVDQVKPLLPANASSVVLVTSRSHLGALMVNSNAKRLHLDVLSPSQSAALLARHGFSRPRTADGAELARLCGHLPLALRIAGAHLSTGAIAIADYLTEIREGDWLSALKVEGDERSAVGASIALSYQALAVDARKLLRCLAGMACLDFTARGAASAIGLDVPKTRTLLEDLASSCLLASPKPGRFALHDLVRGFAIDQSAIEDHAATRRQWLSNVVAGYLQTFDEAMRILHPASLRLQVSSRDDGRPPTEFAEPAVAKQWLEDEHANLMALIGSPNDIATEGIRLLTDIMRAYLGATLHFSDWIPVTNAALSAAEAAGDQKGVACAHLSLGSISWHQGRYAQALAHYQTTYSLGRQTDWIDLQQAALNGMGHIHIRSGDPREATKKYRAAFRLSPGSGRATNLAVSYGGLGSVYWFLGLLKRAENAHHQALHHFTENGHSLGEAITLMNLGMIKHAKGRYEAAADDLNRSLDTYRRMGHAEGEANTQYLVAALHRDTENLPKALEIATAAVELAREARDPRTLSNALNILGTVHRSQGAHDEAIVAHNAGLELAETTGTRYPAIESLTGLAMAHAGLHDLAKAAAFAANAADRAHRHGCRLLEGNALSALCAVYAHDREHADRARQAGQRALAIHGQAGHLLGKGRTLLMLCSLNHAANERCVACAYRKQARMIFTRLGLTCPEP